MTEGSLVPTPSQQAPQERSLRADLVSLNNSAVTLLSKDKCRCTIDTFKDALELLKSDTDTSLVDVALANARRRLEAASKIQVNLDEGVLVLSSQYDPEQAYILISERRTSKVCLTMDCSDDSLTLGLVRAILVYNYGIAHRCCSLSAGASGQAPSEQNETNLRGFCLQIFQYAETLCPPDTTNILFRLVLTRNLMMLSCRLGMALCQHYKETLDPIVQAILGAPQPEGGVGAEVADAA